MWMASFIVYCWMNAAGMTECSEDRPVYEDGSPATHLHTSEVQCQRHMLHDATQSAALGHLPLVSLAAYCEKVDAGA